MDEERDVVGDEGMDLFDIFLGRCYVIGFVRNCVMLCYVVLCDLLWDLCFEDIVMGYSSKIWEKWWSNQQLGWDF